MKFLEGTARRRTQASFLLAGIIGLSIQFCALASVAADFPMAGQDIINHVVQVQLDVGANGTIEETLMFQGQMRIQRQDPHITPSGFRQIDFTVLQWEAVAVSSVLNGEVTYRLSETLQPLSRITAEQMGSDYPAYFKFNLLFDAFSGGFPVFLLHLGMPEGGGHPVVPPNATSPTFSQFEAQEIEFVHPVVGLVRLIPLMCNDQSSVTLEVTLGSLVADLVPGGVELAWETESEIDNEGFWVLRSTDASQNFEVISGPLIPAEGGPAFGAEYAYLDTGVVAGVTYYYLLEDIDTSGVSTLHGANSCAFDVDPDCEALAVTVPGLSAAEFCAAYEVQSKSRKDRHTEERACKEADWGNNEGRHPRDCKVSKGSRRGSKRGSKHGSRVIKACVAEAEAD